MSQKETQLVMENNPEVNGASIPDGESGGQGAAPQEPMNRLFIEDMAVLLKYLSPGRCELLQVLKNTGPTNIRKLSEGLNQDYKSVYNDVAELVHLGLIEEIEDRLVWVPWDEITATLALVPEKPQA